MGHAPWMRASSTGRSKSRWKSAMIACRDRECVTLTETGDIDAGCTKQTPKQPG